MNDNIRSIRHAVQSFKIFMEDRTGRESSTTIYPQKLIFYFLKMYRSKVSSEDVKLKSKGGDINIELTIPCVDLVEVDQIECPCAPASGCSFMKSKYSLPKMVGGMPVAVSTLKPNSRLTNNGLFSYVSWYNVEDKLNGRLSAQSKELYYTMKNINSKRHLYIYGNNEQVSNLKSVAVTAFFSDPLEVAKFPVCGESNSNLCNPLDEEFVIEDEIQARVFELTYNALVGLRNFNPGVDLFNNNSNETTGSPPII